MDHCGRFEPRQNLASYGPATRAGRGRGSAQPRGPRARRELISDAHARFSGPAGDYLDKACTAHRYDRLHLIAPPKFLGQLHKELGKEVQKLVAMELPKDLSWLNTRQIE